MKKEQMVTHDSLAPDVGLVKPITKPPNKRSKVNVQTSLSLSLLTLRNIFLYIFIFKELNDCGGCF